MPDPTRNLPESQQPRRGGRNPAPNRGPQRQATGAPQSQVTSSGQQAPNIPVVADFTSDPRMRSPAESAGRDTSPGPLQVMRDSASSLADIFSSVTEQTGEFGQRVLDEGFIPAAGAEFDETGRLLLSETQPIWEFLFGPPAEESSQTKELSDPSQAFQGGSLGPGGGGVAATGTSVSAGGNSPSRTELTQTVRLPPSPDEVLSETSSPGISQDQLDQFISRLEEARPKDPEQSGLSGTEILAQAGQALANAGQAPTMGQALLALGTGASKSIAQQRQEQEKRRRQIEQAQREFDARLAEAAFSGQQKLADAQRQAEQMELRRDQIAANLQAQRDEAINKLQGVKVQGDNIIVRSIEGINDDGTAEVKTEVISPEQQNSMMDQIALGSNKDDLKLPKIGGTEGQKLLAQATNFEQGVNIFTAMQLAEGTLTPDKIQAKGGQEFFNSLRQRAKARLAKRVGLEEGASMSEIATSYNSMFPNSDLGAEDKLEEMLFQETVKAMSTDPNFQRAVWAGAGFGG